MKDLAVTPASDPRDLPLYTGSLSISDTLGTLPSMTSAGLVALLFTILVNVAFWLQKRNFPAPG